MDDKIFAFLTKIMSEQVKSPQKILLELLYCYLRYYGRFKVAIQ